jgi:HK97 gp10 family phage protein
MGKSIEITGLKELSEMLTQIAPKAAKSYVVKCAKPAAEVIVEAMQSTAPSEVGTLRDSIVYRNQWGIADDGGEALITSVGPNKHVPWGMWQEFGTSHIAGRHWMSQAWSDCQERVLDVFMLGINDLYAKLVARDQSEAMIENDENDRQTGRVLPSGFRRDRNAAYRENDARDGRAKETSQRLQKQSNNAYKESKHRGKDK